MALQMIMCADSEPFSVDPQAVESIEVEPLPLRVVGNLVIQGTLTICLRGGQQITRILPTLDQARRLMQGLHEASNRQA